MRRKDSAMDVRGISPNQEKTGEPARDRLNLTVLGVCTGTGLGHLDCALVQFGQNSPSAPLRVKLQQFDQIPIPASVRDPVVNYLRSGRHKSKPAPHLEDLLGRLFSSGIKAFCRKNALEAASIDLVGTHSNVLRLLNTRANSDGVREHPVHWNAIVTSETGISTVFDFTTIERGVVRRHIHPTSYVDRLFLRHPTKFRVCLNIDELANLSFIPAHGDDGARATISRDCGPGSLFIDYAIRYCTSNDQSEDHDGKMGSLGKVNQDIVDRYLDAHDPFRQLPPISIATEMFGDHEAQQLIDECLYSSMSEADTIATITRITAQNILKQYQRLLELFFPPGQEVDELFICGPSARNSNIIDYLEAGFPEGVITKPLHDIGIPGDAHEAVCYAHLALEAVLSQATQAAGTPPAPSSAYPNADAVRARVVPGRRWNELLSHVLEFSGGQRLYFATNVRIAGSFEAAV
ncbi:hypothetical protein BU25DRAFT_461998 [Macroventuria anomochaeta]|uniref:Uncharacterized protein n=1 Tax=Macroventuria anomochaeta TaxID=301207 RepID=A0ACB6RQD9_9PLEO|nr:uncharacterized protein BU25DRAFT_461998 [Macroventuria anomochaeta]KAF2623348.1 hypothetical protein BU25DRAFT_461998 [Macroventuria anomochaeta]